MLNRREPNLFPFRELQQIRSGYFNFDLFKSIDDVKRTIERRAPSTEAGQETVAQAQGTTAQGLPLATPAAGPSIGQVAGLPKTPSQRLKEGDPLAEEVLGGIAT
tara:strand:- start:244 stop:558 length:315 start_codon:yes stop_codon:yes gene_type:complete